MQTNHHKRLLHTGLQNYDHVDLDAGSVFFAQALRKRSCPCCAIKLQVFEHELTLAPLELGFGRLRWLHLEICPSCGWWHYRQDYESSDPKRAEEVVRSTWWELTHALQTEIGFGSNIQNESSLIDCAPEATAAICILLRHSCGSECSFQLGKLPWVMVHLQFHYSGNRGVKAQDLVFLQRPLGVIQPSHQCIIGDLEP